jgi:hypothetical protein
MFVVLFLLALLGFALWQGFKVPPTTANWQPQLATASTAEFAGDQVTVRNVRNYRYTPTEADLKPNYYDRTYNLNDIKQVWYISEPFANQTYAAHTFLSFEFINGDFLAISIEARKQVGQNYSFWKGFLRTYPLMYVAADERDVVLLRANVRKDDVYVYPVKVAPDKARLLLTDMLTRMNSLQTKPEWYNTLTDNCTSAIVYHINRISPGRLPNLSWQLLLTGYADR